MGAAPRPVPPAVAVAVLAALAGTGHVVYPAFLHLRTRRLPDESPGAAGQLPPLTVVVPAYREESVIAAKVADIRTNGYSGSVHVLVVADDPPTAEAATATGATVISDGQRYGKAMALNRAMGAATTDLVVLTDANTSLRPGSLEAMVAWFSDPTIGAVAGEKSVRAGGEGSYWQFESWLKRREARTGSTFALVGELVAVRRAVFRPLPPDLAVEDLWLALDVLEQGSRIVYEPRARAEEDASTSWRDDWERRTRVVSGVLDVLYRRRRLLAPSRGMLAVQLWGHRLVRSTLGPLAHLVLLLGALRAFPRSAAARLFVVAHLVGAAFAVRTQRGLAWHPLERLVGQAVLLQVVGLGGLIRYLRGDRPALWPKPPRPAGGPVVSSQPP